MNSKATKAALITSLASLVLCFTMLTGTTLAWFVDRVESKNNRIEAGNLEVDLVMLKNGEYVSIANGSGDLFAEAEGTDSATWYPGATKTIYLGIRNKGSLALKYEATIDVGNGGLLGVLDYTVIDLGIEPPVPGEAMSIANDVNSRRGLITGSAQKLLLGRGVLEKATEEPVTQEIQNQTHYYAFSVRMQDDASQSMQGEKVTLCINVSATQLTAEEREERENEKIELEENGEAELPETLSATSWKMKAEVADFTFLETAENEENIYIFPEGTEISDGETTYPISLFNIVTLGETKLLAAMPIENTETEENGDDAEKEEAAVESIFVYFPESAEEMKEKKTDDTEEKTEQETEDAISGWYRIEYAAFQMLLSDEKATAVEIFTSENKITDDKKLPTVTFPESENDILKNADLIKWFASSAKLQAD